MIARLAILALLALTLSTSAQQQPTNGIPVGKGAPAADPAQNGVTDWLVTAECRMVVVPESAALRLIPKLTSRAQAAEAGAEIEKLISEGQAKLAALLLVHGPDRTTVASQTAEEMRYPVEFDPPQLPDKIPDQQPLDVLRAWPAVSITPTAYETRMVGPALDVTPRVNADGTGVRCTTVAVHTRFLHWRTFVAGRLAGGEQLSVEQPVFHSMTSRTEITLQNGQSLLLGVHKPPAPEEGLELFILKVNFAPSEPK